MDDNDKNRGGNLFERFPSLKKLGLERRRRIPYIQQLSDTECGAACLAMVLGYYGKEIGLEEVRDVCGSSRDGMNALAVLNAANLLGLRGRGVKVDEQQFHMLELGTVLHWEFQHFVVLEKMGSRVVEIVDPAYGRRKVPMEEFKKSFTGVALLMEPSEVFEKKKKKDVLWQTVKDVIGRTGLLPRIVVISLLVQIFGLAVPMLTGELIDRVLPRGDLYLLTVILVGLGILIVFQLLATLIRGHLLLHMRTVLDTKMTLGFLDHLVSLPYSYFQLRGAGDLMMRMNSNATVREVLTSSTLSGILDGLLVFLYLGILFVGNTTMALTVVAVASLDVITYLLIRRRQRELAGQNLQVQAKSQSFQVEMLTSMETLKATGNEHRAVSNWSNLFVDALNIDIERGRLSLKLDGFLGALRVAGPLAILAVGALQVMHQEMSLGTMFSLNAVAGSFLMPLSGLVGTAMSMDMLRGYLARVNDVLEAQPEQNRARVKPAHRLSGRIALERVSFRYSPQGAL
ncbi:MAG TPA: cysteine peptidase family C39 domain-containing protein, partial [Polyangia bacterium]|nr:cysteine peptidase family C39 domain-containing protein [Polyangia bacterium]